MGGPSAHARWVSPAPVRRWRVPAGRTTLATVREVPGRFFLARAVVPDAGHGEHRGAGEAEHDRRAAPRPGSCRRSPRCRRRWRSGSRRRSPSHSMTTCPLPVGKVPTPTHSSPLMLTLTEPLGSSGRSVPSVSVVVQRALVARAGPHHPLVVGRQVDLALPGHPHVDRAGEHPQPLGHRERDEHDHQHERRARSARCRTGTRPAGRTRAAARRRLADAAAVRAAVGRVAVRPAGRRLGVRLARRDLGRHASWPWREGSAD